MKKPFPIAALPLALALALALASPPLAETVIDPPADGSVSRAEGLVAWGRINEVLSHPRCANCHPGPSDRPMWSGPSYGETRVHGMNIRAGESRIGIETLPCATCHIGANSDIPHSPPGISGDWRLAPAEAHWFGQTSEFICNQLRDPDRNGDMTYLDLAEHAGHDEILAWAWSPGGTREPAPRSLQDHIDDILNWGVAGQPCPGDIQGDDQ